MKLIGWVEWWHHRVIRDVIEIWAADPLAESRATLLLPMAQEVADARQPESKTKQSLRVRARFEGLRVDFERSDGGIKAIFSALRA